jgi:spore germination protein
MKKYRKVSFTLFLILFGCTPSPKILEDIQLIQSVGYDYKSEKEIIGSAGAAYIPPGEDAQPRNLVFTTVGKTGKQIRQQIQALSAKPIEIGRVGVVIFNEEVASKGVFPFIDNFQRDSSIGRNILLAVSVGSAADILKTNYIESDTVSQYIIDVVDQNMDRTIPDMNFHHFLFQYYTPGFDPFMPLVTKKENKLEVLGIALFEDDKYVGMVPLEKSYIFKLLYEDTQKGHFEMEGEEEDGYISMQNLYTHTDYEVRKSNEGYEANFRIKIKGRIAESGGLDLSN